MFLRLHVAYPRPLGRSLFAFVHRFFTTKNQKEFRISPQLRFLDAIFMRQFSRRCRHRYTALATLTARWRYDTRCRVVAMSKSRPDASKMTHGFFITINSMILYFKHIIHIDDFPLNGHPPSFIIRGKLIFLLHLSLCHIICYTMSLRWL